MTLSDLSVGLILTHASVNDLNIQLIAPDGVTSITLSPNGGAAAGGASGANFGVTANGQSSPTIFTDNGVTNRRIGNANSTAPYMGYYRPASGTTLLDTFRNTQLNGNWTLRITNSGTAVGNLRSWSLNFTSGMVPLQNSVVTTTIVRGAMTAPYPLGATVTGEGIGPGISLASNNTLGAFSPFQGRLYLAFTDRYNVTFNPADNTDIFLMVSDDGGATWGSPGAFRPALPGNRGRLQVNDDDASRDGFSEGRSGVTGRPQFQPEVQVDVATGSVVLAWLDARNDAARARVATYVGASNDGGQSFAPQVYANRSQTAIDAITGQVVNLGPIPDNQSGGNPNTDGTFGYGTHQGLAVYGGHIYPIWASNENSINDINGLARLDIRTARMLISTGPRIIDSTMGAVGLEGDLINPQSPNAAPSVSAFEIVFDRPIDPSSISASMITVFYRNTLTNGVSVAIPIPANGIEFIPTPSDPNNPNNRYGYTRFRIHFTAQTGVGTYSYIIKSSNAANTGIQDRIRNSFATSPLAASGNFMDQNANGLGNETTGSGFLGDAYAAPTPTQAFNGAWIDGTFVPGPYDQDTLPLVLAGPHVIRSQVPGSPVTSDNLVLNNTVNAIDVTFDRDMDPTTITPASILRIMGPSGAITGNFTFTSVNGSARTFRIGFPVQQLNGTYTIMLASTIKSAAGDALDTNLNAGVALLKQTPTSTTVP